MLFNLLSSEITCPSRYEPHWRCNVGVNVSGLEAFF